MLVIPGSERVKIPVSSVDLILFILNNLIIFC